MATQRIRNNESVLIFVVLISAISSGCAGPNSELTVRDQVLRQHRLQREAHLNKDAKAFVSLLADTLISIQDGVISYSGKAENLDRFEAYFASVHEFLAWDDMNPPLVHVSGDGESAWTIVDKIVRYTYYDSTETLRESETRFAWTATYKKRGGEWLVTSNTSTRRPATAPTD